jgi:hypothetical protein
MSLDAVLVLFNGDLENDGVNTPEMDPMVSALKSAGLFNRTFLLRGNHDAVVSGSAALWESYFEADPPNGTYQWQIQNYTSTYGYGSWTTFQPFILNR